MKKLTAFMAVAFLGVTAAHATDGKLIAALNNAGCTKPNVGKFFTEVGFKYTCPAPEIDPASAMAGLTLLLGGLAVVRGRVKKTKQD
jgi:hypothetical protein